MLLLAVQKPQKVPRSRSGYQDVRMRAHAGDPRPCTLQIVSLIHANLTAASYPALNASSCMRKARGQGAATGALQLCGVTARCFDDAWRQHQSNAIHLHEQDVMKERDGRLASSAAPAAGR